jgi:hypothetical protein
LFGLELGGKLMLCNKINKSQLFRLKWGGHLVLCNKVNKKLIV